MAADFKALTIADLDRMDEEDEARERFHRAVERFHKAVKAGLIQIELDHEAA